MILRQTLKSDLKHMIREPIIGLMFFVPIIISIVFKLADLYLVPVIEMNFSVDIGFYYIYILSAIFVISADMIGVVIGFMMLDDKDGHILELISVTPLGKSGYLINRLGFMALFTFIFTFVSYFILDMVRIPIFTLIFIALMLSILSACIGLLLSSLASDKVKGLTYAKGLNFIIIFCFADLIDVEYIRVVSAIFPTYWVSSIIENFNEAVPYIFGLITTLFWFLVIYRSNKYVKY